MPWGTQSSGGHDVVRRGCRNLFLRRPVSTPPPNIEPAMTGAVPRLPTLGAHSSPETPPRPVAARVRAGRRTDGRSGAVDRLPRRAEGHRASRGLRVPSEDAYVSWLRVGAPTNLRHAPQPVPRSAGTRAKLHFE